MNIAFNSKLFFLLALLSLLLVDIGLEVSGYKVTIALLFLLLSFFLMRLSIKTLIFVSLYFVATLISSLKQIELFTLVKILLVCFMMASTSSSVYFKLNELDKKDVIKYFEITFRIVFVLVLIEFLFANILEFSIYDPSRLAVTYGSFVRPFFIFTEPAILSIYAVFSFIVFDLLEKSEPHKKSYTFNKILCVLIIIFTVSFTGIIMLLGHNLIYLLRFRLFSLNLKNLYIFFSRIFFVILITSIIFFIFPEVFNKLYSRLIDVVNVTFALTQLDLNSVNLNSSVGYRLVTVFSVIDYMVNGSYFQIFFGEGFLNFHLWIIDRYSFFVGDGTIIEDGDVTNLLAVIFLSGGIVGSLLFMLYINSLANQVSTEYKAFLYIFIFCFMLVYGGLTEPHFFIFIYIFLVFFNKNNTS